MDLSAYLAIFLDESRENLQQLNQHLLALEDNSADRSHLDAIFRVAHTLKGMSATMGFQGIADLTHKMEELLDHLRTGKGDVSQGVLDTLFQCLDALEAQVDCAANGTEPEDVSALVEQLKSVISGATAPAAAAEAPATATAVVAERPFSETETRMLDEAVRTGYSAFELLVFLMPGCLMKSLRVTLVMRALEPLGTVIRTVPTVAEMEADAMGDSFRLTIISLEDEAGLRAAVMSVAEIAAVTLEPVRHGETTATTAPSLLAEMVTIAEGDKRIISEAAKQGMAAHAIEVGLQPGTMLKSARAIMAVRQVETRGELIRILPSAEAIEQEAFGDSFAMLLLSPDPAADVARMLRALAEVVTVEVQTIDPEPATSESPKAPATTAAPPTVAAAVAEKTETPAEAHGAPAHGAPANGAAPGAKQKAMATIRVDTEKLDELMNLMGELVISRTRLNQLASQHQANEIMQAVQHLTTITTDLQTVAMKLRMVSIEHVFNRFPRMVRDLGRTLQKDIDLTVIGQDTELDRSVIDMIGDPLVHLIRNSADHGLESTEERLAKGKPAIGHIRLEAKQEGGMVVVSVEDDGRGMDAAKIRQKAIDKKVITPEQGAMMDEWEALQLIFAAGFSTRDVANEVSGRGVGLDAVKELVNQMGGMIELSTTVNQGSRFAIKLPLTLAIMQALLTRVQHETYAIPLAAVEEAVSITSEQIKRVQNRPVMVLRGETIPLIHLTDRLDVPENGFGLDEEMPVVIVNSSSGSKQNQKTGLVVTTLIGQEEIVIKPLSRTVRTSPYIAGAATLGDGSIALILNTPSIS
jgi:two-component system chemotaxis sensor kinase CheA